MSTAPRTTPQRWQQIEDLFHAALEQPESDRARFLSELCGSDNDLRFAVEQLLEGAAKDDGFMDAPVGGFLTGGATDTPALTLEGRRIGRYDVMRVIASGGMGTVYEALQVEPKRKVALKVLRTSVSGGSSLRRFKDEAAILGRLQHPNVARILEAGTFTEARQPVPYFALEYIQGGRPITEYATDESLSIPARLELFLKVCDAVHHGHQNGVIHRDLKPANILVDANGSPKVIDFGVARMLDSDVSRTTMQTGVGQLIGTLAYASPEQLFGDPQRIDIRTDVYSLGVVLYELLCRRLPYTVENMPITEAVTVVKDAPPQRPSTIHRALRGDLETIVLKALAKEPEGRYASVSEFAGDIRSFLSNEPIRARPASMMYQLRMFARRNRSLVTAGFVVVLALVTATIVSSVFWMRESEQRERAVKIAALESEQREKAERVKSYLAKLFGSARPELAQGREVTVREVLDEFAPRLSDDLHDQPDVEAETHALVGGIYFALGVYDTAEQHYRRALEIQTSLDDDSPAFVETLEGLGGVLTVRGRPDEAEPYLRRALEVAERISNGENTQVARTLIGLAESMREQHRFDEAEALLLRAMDILKDYPDEDDGAAANNLATLYDTQGRQLEAVALLQTAVERMRAAYDGDHQDIAAALNNIAGIYFERGRQDEAERYFREALTVAENLLGDEHLLVAHIRNNYACLLSQMGKLEEAERLTRKALAVYGRILGESHPHYASAMHNLGSVLVDQGDSEAGLPILEQSLSLKREHLPPGDPGIALSLVAVARAESALGQLEQAESHLRESLDIYREALPADHPYPASALVNLGEVLIKRSDFPSAEEALRRSLAIWASIDPENGSLTMRARILLGESLTGQNRFEDAEAVLLEAETEAAEGQSSGTQQNAARKALVHLYEVWGRNDRADAYRSEVGGADNPPQTSDIAGDD